MLAGLADLALLAALARVLPLVVTAEEQHHLSTMEVHEHPEKDAVPVTTGCSLVFSEHPPDLVAVVAHPELVEPLTERLEPFGPGQVESALGEDQPQRGVERDELGLGQLVDPGREWSAPSLGLVDLERGEWYARSWDLPWDFSPGSRRATPGEWP